MPKGVRRVGPLDTVRRCRIEMAKIYKEARRGQLETSEAKSFTWILRSLAELIRDSDLEQRVEALEQANESKKAGGRA